MFDGFEYAHCNGFVPRFEEERLSAHELLKLILVLTVSLSESFDETERDILFLCKSVFGIKHYDSYYLNQTYNLLNRNH